MIINPYTREGLWQLGRAFGYSDRRIRTLFAKVDAEYERLHPCEPDTPAHHHRYERFGPSDAPRYTPPTTDKAD